jgi:lipopolysaccharide transport system ATP-binding protein
MGETAIRVEKLSKQLSIGAGFRRHDTLRDQLTQTIKGLIRRNGRRPADGAVSNSIDTFWALKDVSFEVRKGEAVGIIGRNGAGKSTLLKILSRITEPTEGRVDIHGRVGSLLEVGTGFHSELTGRENIFLNGAILGMRKTEIQRKFEEIVAFAEVERFIDTQVKHYSTGMYLRLAFSVAAHLEPEILIIDEVLAVGDAEFQKKCLEKMENVGQQGRTVIFVSHNMAAIARLCERAILLNEGGLLKDGPSHQVIGAYLNSGIGTSALREWHDQTKAPGTNVLRLCAMRLRGADGQITDRLDIREPIGLEMEYVVLEDGYVVIPHFSVHNEGGLQLFSVVDTDSDWRGRRRPAGRYISTAWIPGNFLAEGTIIVGPAANTLHPNILHFHARDAVAFCVVDSFDGNSARGDFAGVLSGVVRPILRWATQRVTE